MKLSRCPVCHTNLHLDALIQDQAGRELLSDVSSMPDFVSRPMLAYLSLFRPAKSDLSNSRALRLMREVTDMFKVDHLLASALSESVGKLREKRQQTNDVKPLANHNYLKSVYKTLAAKNNIAYSEDQTTKGESAPAPKPDNSQWYVEQAQRMLKVGKDPLAADSTIADKLREMNWEPPHESTQKDR